MRGGVTALQMTLLPYITLPTTMRLFIFTIRLDHVETAVRRVSCFLLFGSPYTRARDSSACYEHLYQCVARLVHMCALSNSTTMIAHPYGFMQHVSPGPRLGADSPDGLPGRKGFTHAGDGMVGPMWVRVRVGCQWRGPASGPPASRTGRAGTPSLRLRRGESRLGLPGQVPSPPRRLSVPY